MPDKIYVKQVSNRYAHVETEKEFVINTFYCSTEPDWHKEAERLDYFLSKISDTEFQRVAKEVFDCEPTLVGKNSQFKSLDNFEIKVIAEFNIEDILHPFASTAILSATKKEVGQDLVQEMFTNINNISKCINV